MSKHTRSVRAILILISFLLLSGCWDYRDVDKRSIVITVGVAKIKGQITYITEIAKFLSEKGGQGGQVETSNVFVDESSGKDFEDARMAFNSRRSFPTFLGATRVVIFGPDFAKEGIEAYINRINKLYDYRKTLLAVVSRETPEEIIKTSVEDDLSVGFFIEDKVFYLANMGLTVYPTIGEILSYMAFKDVGYVLPYIGKENGAIQYLGLAIMKDSKLIGVITIQDSLGFLYLKAKNMVVSETINSFKGGDNSISFRLSLDQRKIKTQYVDDQIIIDVTLKISGQLQYQYYRNPISDQDLKLMEEILRNKIKTHVEEIVKKSQKEYDCDIFQFAQQFRADHPEKYKNLIWEDIYSEINFNFNVDVLIRNMNMSDPNAKKIY